MRHQCQTEIWILLTFCVRKYNFKSFFHVFKKRMFWLYLWKTVSGLWLHISHGSDWLKSKGWLRWHAVSGLGLDHQWRQLHLFRVIRFSGHPLLPANLDILNLIPSTARDFKLHTATLRKSDRLLMEPREHCCRVSGWHTGYVRWFTRAMRKGVALHQDHTHHEMFGRMYYVITFVFHVESERQKIDTS